MKRRVRKVCETESWEIPMMEEGVGEERWRESGGEEDVASWETPIMKEGVGEERWRERSGEAES